MPDDREQLPPPPAASYRGRNLEVAALDQRLRALREELQRRADFAASAAATAAVILLLYDLALLYVLLVLVTPVLHDVHGGASAGMLSSALVWLSLAIFLLLALATYLVAVVATIRSLFPYYYRVAWQGIQHRQLGQLFADEERQRLLLDALPSQWWTGANGKLAPRNLEDRLEFCAYHVATLKQLTRRAEPIPRLNAAVEQLAHGAAWLFRNPAVFWVASAAGVLFGGLALPLLFLALYPALGGRTIAACASLAAFLDLCLDDPRIEVDNLPLPAEPHGWWARTVAPWESSS